MYYALIHNNSIEVGPRQWLWSAFKEYLDDNELDASALPRKSPTEPIITTEWKILSVVDPAVPDHTYPYEQLAGPYWTINETNVTGIWNIVPVDIEISKRYLKDIVTNNRYAAEVGGIKVTVQGNEVTIDTSRDGRQIYFDTYLAMSDTETISWKFAEMWMAVTKSDMGQIVLAGKEHIQNCFSWEKNTWDEIDLCVDRSELEEVDLNCPYKLVVDNGPNS
jgi:hypothetical protein